MQRVCKLIITLTLTFLIAFSAMNLASFASYTDVYVGHWAYDAIDYATRSKLFNGYEDGSFQPNRTMTRAEAMKVLVSFLRRDVIKNKTSYTDVAVSDWFAPYVEAGKDLLPAAYGETFFRPNESITREDTIFAIVRSMNLGRKVQYVDVQSLQNYADCNQIDAAVEPYLAIAVQLSLISGYSDGTIQPKKALTRAEFATLLYRSVQLSNGISLEETVSEQEMSESSELSLFTANHPFLDQLKEEIDKVRDEYGVKHLLYSPKLSEVAQKKAEDMYQNGYFGHTSPTYGSVAAMLKEAKLLHKNQDCGENIAQNISEAAEVIASWKNSTGNKHNLTNSSYTDVGIGYVEDGNIVVVMFVG